jgi:hypothetical protein
MPTTDTKNEDLSLKRVERGDNPYLRPQIVSSVNAVTGTITTYALARGKKYFQFQK